MKKYDTFLSSGCGSRELEGAKKCGLATVMVEGIVKEFLAEAQLENRRMYADYRVQFIDELLNM